jgi:hypothetical protein
LRVPRTDAQRIACRQVACPLSTSPNWNGRSASSRILRRPGPMRKGLRIGMWMPSGPAPPSSPGFPGRPSRKDLPCRPRTDAQRIAYRYAATRPHAPLSVASRGMGTRNSKSFLRCSSGRDRMPAASPGKKCWHVRRSNELGGEFGITPRRLHVPLSSAIARSCESEIPCLSSAGPPLLQRSAPSPAPFAIIERQNDALYRLAAAVGPVECSRLFCPVVHLPLGG